MQDTIRIYCKNDHRYYDIQRGTPLLEVYKQIKPDLKFPVVAAFVNYKIQDLTFLVYKPKDIEFIDASCPAGMRCYVRTLLMVLSCAVEELYPQAAMRVMHPICKGYYCQLVWDKSAHQQPVTEEMVKAIKERMTQIIAEDRPIIAEEKQTKEVIKLFRERLDDEKTLFETLGNPYCRYFSMGNFIDYYTDALMPSSGYLNIFDLTSYKGGLFLRIPNRQKPDCLEDIVEQDKMFDIFNEFRGWNKLLHINNVGEYNIAFKNSRTFELIKLSEALHEKKIAQIADEIASSPSHPRFVLISGPSSSGKTTFSKRLSIQLMVNGLRPVAISIDDFFVNREDTPKDANGEWDFEDIHAIDLPFFQEKLNALLRGEEIELPTFDFESGTRKFKGNTLKLQDDNIVILEGLHALNPELTPNIPEEAKYRIFVSCLTTINLDNHNWIPTEDIRLIRRIVRDYNYRGYSARETINRCPSVRRGEEKWIYPFQENANSMFNSSLIFELAVLKKHAEPILEEVPKYCAEFAEAHRLQKFLSYFETIPENEIPPTSFLREFVGGSSFNY